MQTLLLLFFKLNFKNLVVEIADRWHHFGLDRRQETLADSQPREIGNRVQSRAEKSLTEFFYHNNSSPTTTAITTKRG
jgi:hypothetical protein